MTNSTHRGYFKCPLTLIMDWPPCFRTPDATDRTHCSRVRCNWSSAAFHRYPFPRYPHGMQSTSFSNQHLSQNNVRAIFGWVCAADGSTTWCWLHHYLPALWLLGFPDILQNWFPSYDPFTFFFKLPCCFGFLIKRLIVVRVWLGRSGQELFDY